MRGATEERDLGGATESRGVAGKAKGFRCKFVDSCSGYRVSGHGMLEYFDGEKRVSVPDRCVPMRSGP